MRSVIEQNHFTLRAVRQLEENGGRLWELEHNASGAQLVWQDRDEENMTFAIAFRTVPEDSTGVFHILEHSVLCGSGKYPVKEPFVELMKSSLKTFLNAMTFPDKTVYPVSSRNRQDFLNLVSVYMDAVLHPAITHKPEIFRQEGWRYELQEDGTPAYQGVVYNEMKGAYSSVDSVLEKHMNLALFPDNCYSFDSGGDPEHIPELTYQQFLACHRKYYHPSNAQIVLDGQVDLGAVLALLDSFLSSYTRQEADFPIPMQKALPYEEVTVPYEIGADEPMEGKTIISRGCLFGDFSDREESFAAKILADYLTDGSEAPLKKAILDAGLGADMVIGFHEGIQQSWIGWEVWNTDPEKLPKIKETVKNTLTQILVQGLDQQRLEAYYSLLSFALQNRDGGGYQGVNESINILASWLYGGDPTQNLSFRETLDSLRRKLGTDYFPELIRTYLLQEETGALVMLVPSQTLGQERRESERQRVLNAWNGMNAEQRERVKAEGEALARWQQSEDSEAALATIPVLRLSDIPEEPRPLTAQQSVLGGTTVLRHCLDSSLVYMNLHFNACDLTREELPCASLLCELLGKLPTAKRGSAALQTQLLRKVGNLNYAVDVYPNGLERYRASFAVRSACLPEYQEDAAGLLLEILNETLYENKTLVRDILRQQKNNAQRNLISNGNRYAASRVAARQTAAGAAAEYLSGCEYIRWLNENSSLTDEQLEALLKTLETLAKKLFARQRLVLSASHTVKDAVLEAITAGIPEAGAAPVAEGSCPLLESCREGILIPAGVGYAAKGANLARLGSKYTGKVHVLSKVLSLQYLWNVIRVQGGAYGTGFYGTDNGDLTFYTYRDPSPARSLECFDRTSSFLTEFCGSDGELDKIILGAVADVDPMRSNTGKIRAAESRHFRGTSFEDVCRERRELLRTTKAELLEFGDVLTGMADTENICVVGGQAQLDACGEALTNIRSFHA